MRQNREYQICKAIATYLRLQYPSVIFHFDYAGLHHTKTQAGQMKAIQGCKGWPDLFIAYPKNNFPERSYKGLFIEVKKEGFNIRKRDGVTLLNEHIKSQSLCLYTLRTLGYKAEFGIGFDNCKQIIDSYLK